MIVTTSKLRAINRRIVEAPRSDRTLRLPPYLADRRNAIRDRRPIHMTRHAAVRLSTLRILATAEPPRAGHTSQKHASLLRRALRIVRGDHGCPRGGIVPGYGADR